MKRLVVGTAVILCGMIGAASADTDVSREGLQAFAANACFAKQH